jgi:hypothetical protein
LRLSLVCRRFFQVIENDKLFMQTVKFRACHAVMRQLWPNPHARLIRTYETVSFSSYDYFQEFTPLELALIENVKIFQFSSCKFPDTNELVLILKRCKQLKTVDIAWSTFEAEENEPMEKFENPVSLVIDSPFCKSWTCFANISHISVRDWHSSRQVELANFLSQHAGVIRSMFMVENGFDKISQLLFSRPEIKLEQIDLHFETQEFVTDVTRFLAHQSTSLRTLWVENNLQQQMFNAICLNLVNLETLNLELIKDAYNIRLSDLKALPRLKKLALNFWESALIDFELDLGALLSLEQLKLTYSGFRVFKLAAERSIVTLKKLELNIPVESHIWGQLATIFPNLRNLNLSPHVSIAHSKHLELILT